MNTQAKPARLRCLCPAIFVLTALVLLALWWAFRPEKLFLNHKVNEPPPALLITPLPFHGIQIQCVSWQPFNAVQKGSRS